MVLSYVLLIAFTVQWLQSQYRSERDQLSKDIARLFTSVQEQISDSLLLHSVVQPIISQQKVHPTSNATLPYHSDSTDPISAQGFRLMLQNARKLTASEKQAMFRVDTVVFNEMFATRLKQQGWDFSAKWVRNRDSGMETNKRIFIPSNFFTSEYGVIVDRYNTYLYRKMLPQSGFVLILLAVTGIAFWSTYKSLREQIKLSHLKDDFVNNMSHELKTPIATVKLALEALTNFSAMDDIQRRNDYLSMASIEMDRLEMLTHKVLNTSLLENGKMFIKPEPCDLKELIGQTIQALRPKLEMQDATIQFETTGHHFTSSVDKLHTQGVLLNIIDNSLKYGVAPVDIRLSLREHEHTIQLAVQDNGPGIPEEYKDKVFDKFFRVPTGNKHNIKGFGLGLSYAAQVMQQHKGSIKVNNMPTGGCMFTLTF